MHTTFPPILKLPILNTLVSLSTAGKKLGDLRLAAVHNTEQGSLVSVYESVHECERAPVRSLVSRAADSPSSLINDTYN